MDLLKKRGNKYLTFASTDENKKVFKKHILKNYVRLLHKIESLMECNSVNKPGKYEKDYMKIKFSSDDNL